MDETTVEFEEQPPQHVLSVEVLVEPPKGSTISDNPVGVESEPPVNDENGNPQVTKAKHESTPESDSAPEMNPIPAKHARKKPRKPIFVSYSPDCGFPERQFVCEVVRELRENNLAEDVWFDRGERNLTSATWLSERLEMTEKCRAAICVLSGSYLQSPPSVYELRVLADRQSSPNPPKVFLIFLEELVLPKRCHKLTADCIDLTLPATRELSAPERASITVGSLISKLESFAVICAMYNPPPREDNFNDRYKGRNLCDWTIHDLQCWLLDLGVREFYRQNFAELFVDGFLMMSMVDGDLESALGIDNRAVRRKLLREVIAIQEKERQLGANWHLRIRLVQRPKLDHVYVIYDPIDVRLAQNLKGDLKAKGFLTKSHDKLGQSREEFLRLNGPTLACCKNVIVLLTEGASSSPFVLHEVLFADWLGRSVMSLVFKNTWEKLRPSLRAILGDSMAIDFEREMYSESIDVLEHHLKPVKTVPGVILEQDYLNRMNEGLRPLSAIVSGNTSYGHSGDSLEPRVYISYQWDAQNRVAQIRRILEANDVACFADPSSTVSQVHRPSSHAHTVNPTGRSDVTIDGLQFHLQRNLKSSAVVVCVITPQYLQTDVCLKDVVSAESLNKPIVPVLLRFVPWPPDVGTPSLRRIFAQTSAVDMSNDRLFHRNAPVLVERLGRYFSRVGKKSR